MAARSSKKVLVLLAQGFEDAEAAIALSACRWSEYRQHLPRIEAYTTGMHACVEGRFGTRYAIDIPLELIDADSFDALVIPGGFRDHGFDEIYCEPVYELIRNMHAHGACIATMCVGVLPVARSGILQGLQATTYEFSRHSNYAILEECGCAGVHVPVCESNGIISCSGPAYSEDVIEKLLEKLIGPDAAAELTEFRRGIRADLA